MTVGVSIGNRMPELELAYNRIVDLGQMSFKPASHNSDDELQFSAAMETGLNINILGI